MEIPWNEKINIISINPDCATRNEIARLAAELSEANDKIWQCFAAAKACEMGGPFWDDIKKFLNSKYEI
jgi:hypothetical protein